MNQRRARIGLVTGGGDCPAAKAGIDALIVVGGDGTLGIAFGEKP